MKTVFRVSEFMKGFLIIKFLISNGNNFRVMWLRNKINKRGNIFIAFGLFLFMKIFPGNNRVGRSSIINPGGIEIGFKIENKFSFIFLLF